jgi:hypothetical protein
MVAEGGVANVIVDAVAPPVPVKYVLYSHYAYQEADDFKDWKEHKTPCHQLKGVRYLVSHLKDLERLLTSPAYEGLLVLFYSPGFADSLDGIARSRAKDDLLHENEQIRFASEVSNHLSGVLRRYSQLSERVRFVTPIDLYDIFGRMQWSKKNNLRWWFVGRKPTYDSPKIIEAIVRLRLLGTGVPVFRLDWDVLFRRDNTNTPDLGLFKPVASCLKAYQLRLDDPRVATFLFSASYDTAGLGSSSGSGGFQGWRRGFATRVFPALPVEKNWTEIVSRPPKRKQQADVNPWEHYAESVFDEDLARRFYGLGKGGLVSDCVSGIGEIGAHPTVSVISGALLCLSEGAILDLPPFSNFSLNVSWIDDHLKYCLHRELRHLTTVELNVEPLLSDAKLDTVMVHKQRPAVGHLPSYVLENYLPTLLWGTVMDAWITKHPLLKYRPSELSEQDKNRWEGLRERGLSEGVLPHALQVALEKSEFTRDDQKNLQKDLNETALKRINNVRKQWSELRTESKETFASAWASGKASVYFKSEMKKYARTSGVNLTDKWKGLARGDHPEGDPLTKEEQLNPSLRTDFSALKDDAIEYINWTLNWPKIVQVVRSVEQGTVRTDLSWRPR